MSLRLGASRKMLMKNLSTKDTVGAIVENDARLSLRELL